MGLSPVAVIFFNIENNLQKLKHLKIELSRTFWRLIFISVALTKNVTDSNKTFQNTKQNFFALRLIRKTLDDAYVYKSHYIQDL